MRRNAALRKRIGIFAAVLCMLAIFAIGLFNIRANAQGKDEVLLYKYYKSISIQNGDTLEKIASEYAPSGDEARYIHEVMRMNQLEEDHLISGMNLVIPYYSSDYFALP